MGGPQLLFQQLVAGDVREDLKVGPLPVPHDGFDAQGDPFVPPWPGDHAEGVGEDGLGAFGMARRFPVDGLPVVGVGSG